ncbi:hypothetical protein WDW89_06635 [Deltaproteobacteria bacterium TL4]
MKTDEIWKEIIELLFEEFCAFFLPDLAKHIDFQKEVEFLEKERARLFPESEEIGRRVDKLIKVYLKSGQEQWILIHVEVQGYRDTNFSERMFVYYYRVYDRFKQKLVAFALFTDPSPNYKPERYDYEFYGTKLEYSYRHYKVLEQEESELLNQSNPFALAIIAAQYALKAKGNEDQKIVFKLKLIRILLECEYSKEQIRHLFRFIDGLLKLNDEMKRRLFYEELHHLQGEHAMPFLTDVEEVAMEKGIEKGIEKGKLIGEIRTLEFVLQRSQTQEEVLEHKSLEKLILLRDQFKQQLLQRQVPGKD